MKIYLKTTLLLYLLFYIIITTAIFVCYFYVQIFYSIINI